MKPYFNSIKVRLEPLITLKLTCSISNFNSIKVRLEPYPIPRPTWPCGFQFHKGTIRTHESADDRPSEGVFQFHKGTIRTRYVLLWIVSFSNFNSIKVRLEPSLSGALFSRVPFQFHKGTIRTGVEQVWLSFLLHFNSIKVRLEQRQIYLRQTQGQFQFHKGTIRTTMKDGEVTGVVLFQFHKGTIRTRLKAESFAFVL